MIHTLTPADVAELAEPLCQLLWDAVDSGASVGFLPPLDPVTALAYWDSVQQAIHEGSRVLLVEVEDGELRGSVQLELAGRANAQHRAEVAKLLVHRNARRRGIGTALMQAIETAARERGRTLLVLDTRTGDPSDALYRKLGYIAAGEIPRYARSAAGSLDATVFFYKELR